MAIQQDSSANVSYGPATTVDPAEVAKFSKLSEEWWDPKGKMAPLHKINPLRLSYIRDAACRKFERNVKSLNCLAGLRILDIGCGAGLLCEPFTRLGAQVIGVDPSASNIAAARLHAEKGHLSIDYRCTTVEQMDLHERFDIVLAMEVVEHVTDVGMFLNRCATMLKPGGLMVISTLNRNWKSFALAIVGAEYLLRWLPRGTHQWDKFVTPDELAHYLRNNNLAITDQKLVMCHVFGHVDFFKNNFTFRTTDLDAGEHIADPIRRAEGYEPNRAIFERAKAAGGAGGGACLSITEAPEDAVEGAHVVNTDVWASMGQEEEAESRRNAFRGYTVNPDLMKLADPKAIFLHCLPAHRGEEVSADVIEGPQSRVWDQAENRLHVQKALLATLMG